jgi:phosphoglycolate phosphatase
MNAPISKIPLQPAASALCAAIIDLDGTMVETLGDFHAALNAMLHELSLPKVEADVVRCFVGRGSENLIRRVLARVLSDEAAERHYEQAHARYQHHYAQVNGRYSDVYAGVHEGLQALAQQNMRLACLTNKPTGFAQSLLQKKGLLKYFEVVFGGDAFTHKKPHPAPVLQTCQHLGVTPAETLMIGDSRNDAEAARAAGCTVALVPYGYNHGEPIEQVPCDLRGATLADIAFMLRA